MQNLLEQIAEGLIIISYQGNIIDYNKHFLEKIQLEGVDRGCHIREFLEEPLIAQEIVNAKEDIPCEIHFIGGRQKIYPYYCKNIGMTYEGQPVRALLLFDRSDECSKADLIELLKRVPYSIWIKDAKGRFVFLNDAVKYCYYKDLKSHNLDDLIGYTGQELSEYWRFMKVMHMYKDHQEKHYSSANQDELPDQEVIKSKSIQFYEECIPGGEGENGDTWLDVCRIPILDEKEDVKFVVCIKRNMTEEKKRTLETMDSQKEFFKLKHLHDLEDMEFRSSYDMLEETKNDLMKQLMAEGLLIGIYNEEREQLIFIVRGGICEQRSISIDHIAIEKEIFDHLLSESSVWGIRPIEERDTTRFNVLLNLLDVKNVGLYPIRYKDKLMGVLLSTYQKDRNILSHLEDSFIYSICNKITHIIEHSHLLVELRSEWFEYKKAEEELESFLQLSTDLLVMMNQKGIIVRANKGWLKLLGWKQKEVEGRPWLEFVHPDDRVKIDRIVSHIGEKENMVVRYRAKDETYKWLRWNGRFMKDQGVAYLVAKDITQEKVQEEQRIIYETTLQKEKLKTEFLANISHEFKTPINIIVSAVQLIQAEIGDLETPNTANGPIIEKVNKRMYAIKQNGYRLLRLVNNIIELTKIDSGYLKGKFSNVDFIELIEDIATSTVCYLENKKIKLIFDTEVEELILACDPGKMERIILNLLSNAAKYMQRAGNVWVDIKLERQNVVIYVRDNGVGIPEDKLSHIFERFTQANDSVVRKSEGSGLGLAIVKSLVEAQKGEISVSSKVGIGTEFRLAFPIWQIEDEKIESASNLACSRVERCLVEFSDVYQA